MTEKEMYDRINGVSQDTGFSINEKARGLDGTFAALMRKVYVWMTLALVITGFTASSVDNSPAEHHLHKFRIDVGTYHWRTRTRVHHQWRHQSPIADHSNTAVHYLFCT